MKNKSLTLNALFNMVKTVSSLILPLITFPYITRVLTVESIGSYNFSASVVSYFALLASLGINTYAIREGTKYRENKMEMSVFASEIFSLNIYSTVLSYVCLFIALIFIPKLQGYRAIILILSLEMLFTTLGTSWVYNIHEEFGYITLATCLFQILSLVLLFVFVKTENDLYLYTCVVASANIGSNIFYRSFSGKFCKIRFTTKINRKQHLRPILILFSTAIAATIYVSSDMMILGFLTSDYNVGIYSVAVKIYKIVKQLFLAIVVVMIPRAATLFNAKRMDECKSLLNNVINTLLFIGLPGIVGLMSLGSEFITIISGEKYIEGTPCLQMLGAALMFAIFSSFFSNCILIPNRKEKVALYSTIISAGVNIVLNIVLIPFFQEKAAAFTTLLSEMITCGITAYSSYRIIKLDYNVKDWTGILVGCLGVFVSCRLVSYLHLSIIPQTIIAIVLSVVVYGLIALMFRNTVMKSVVEWFQNKLKKVK